MSNGMEAESPPLEDQTPISEGEWYITTDAPPVMIVTSPVPDPPVPEPAPDAFDYDPWHPITDGRWGLWDFQGQRWLYQIEWGRRDPDLLPGCSSQEEEKTPLSQPGEMAITEASPNPLGDAVLAPASAKETPSDAHADDYTRLAVIWAYRHLPNENRATRNAKEAVRRAAREAIEKEAIEADEFDLKKTQKKVRRILPLENVDPAVETIVFAHVRLLASIVGGWIKKFLDAKAVGMETRRQISLARIRFGNQIRLSKCKGLKGLDPKAARRKRAKSLEKRTAEAFGKIDRKLNDFDRQLEALEQRRTKTLQKLKARIQKKMKAEGIERIEVRGKPLYQKAGQRQWYILEKTVKELNIVRRERDALERKRWLAAANRYLPKQPKGPCGATIADQLFAECLFKLFRLVPLLPRLGKREQWDADDVPDHIARYVRTVAKHAILDYIKANKLGKPSEIRHYLHLRRWREENHNRITCYEPMGAGGDSPYENNSDLSADTLYTGNACYVAQSSQSGVVELEEREFLTHALKTVCRDFKDPLLLTMKREGMLSEDEIAEMLDLSVKQVHKRWWRMRKELVKLFELHRRKCNEGEKEKSKHCTQVKKERKRAEEIVASWRTPVKPVAYVPAPHFLVNRGPTVISAEYLASISTDAEAVALVMSGLRAISRRADIPGYEVLSV